MPEKDSSSESSGSDDEEWEKVSSMISMFGKPLLTVAKETDGGSGGAYGTKSKTKQVHHDAYVYHGTTFAHCHILLGETRPPHGMSV